VKNIPLNAKGTKRGYCVIGCLVVEKIERAFRLIEENFPIHNTTQDTRNTNEITQTKEKEKSPQQKQITLPLLLSKSMSSLSHSPSFSTSKCFIQSATVSILNQNQNDTNNNPHSNNNNNKFKRTEQFDTSIVCSKEPEPAVLGIR
jgi:hypothetical protein